MSDSLDIEKTFAKNVENELLERCFKSIVERRNYTDSLITSYPFSLHEVNCILLSDITANVKLPNKSL